MNTTHIYKLTRDNQLHIQMGLNGNYYLFSADISKLQQACDIVGRAYSAIYYRTEYECWAIRFKSKSLKLKIDLLKEDLLKIK